MHIYVLDNLYRPTSVFDTFNSLIWTERYDEKGDFELTTFANREARSTFTPGAKLRMNLSDRIMIVETIDENVDEEGRSTMVVKGYSAEAILDDRIARHKLVNSTADQGLNLTGRPHEIIETLVSWAIYADGPDPAYDPIPNVRLVTNNANPRLPAEVIKVVIDFVTTYEAVQNICRMYDLGFKLTPSVSYSSSYLNFEVLAGSDRTASQVNNAPVIFAPEFENLRNTRKVTSISASKNVAYVISDYGTAIVYPSDVSPDQKGFDRRVLIVKTNDVEANDPDIPGALKLIGQRELAKYRSFGGFDGEISQNSQYKYGRDYFLGDLVELRDNSGMATQMRVTEQIFVSDEQGIRSYPTLVAKTFVNSGSWAAWPAAQQWIDLDPSPLTWSEVTQ